MAEPRAVPFLLRLLIAWITFYYTIFMDAVSRAVEGLLQSDVFTDSSSPTSSSRSNRTAERTRRSRLRARRFQLWLEDLQGMRDDEFRDIFRINRAILEYITAVDAFLMHFLSVFKGDWVHFPTRDDLDEMAEEFRAVKEILAVVGAIDGTHIQMKGMEGHRQEYYTCKSAYAVQLQLTCDA
ncbi:unnamed protein product [Closterium sp. Naga37s-1]|nr:unnamed protein product [Closterium sp. Naga37s-1]